MSGVRAPLTPGPSACLLSLLLLLLRTTFASAQQIPAGQPESMLFSDIPVVTGASLFQQDADEAPASVTVITAQEIARHGWRTLADALQSVPGFYAVYDRNYTSVGVRGYGQPGDFNDRVLVLLDGQRLNENVGGRVYIGTESPIEMDLVDRMEVIRGPGSSLYGTGAFFAVVNVMMKRGRDIGGAQLSAAIQSFGGRQARVTLGRQFQSGVEVLVSGTLYRSAGQDLHFPEFDSGATENGRAVGLDRDERDQAMVRISRGPLTLLSNLSWRRKEIPTASFGTLFNQPGERSTDQNTMIALQFAPRVSERGQLETSLSYNSFNFDGVFPYADRTDVDYSRGRWWLAEASYSMPIGPAHLLVVGGEYQLNTEQTQGSSDGTLAMPRFRNTTVADNAGLFAQDEIRLSSRLLLNAGLRFDHSGLFGGTVNPRLGLIYHETGTGLKLLAGRAFRAPSNFEQYYADGTAQKQSLTLGPEEIWSLEAGLDHRLTRHWRVSLSAYQNWIRGLITLLTDPADSVLVFRNAGSVDARGLELGAQGEVGGFGLRLSYGLQHAYDRPSAGDAANSPRHLVKLHLSRLLFRDRLSLGAEVLGMSDRVGSTGARVPGHVTTNLNLRTERWPRGLSAGLSVYNLFDARYADPASAQHVQTVIPQDGRSVRVTLEADF